MDDPLDALLKEVEEETRRARERLIDMGVNPAELDAIEKEMMAAADRATPEEFAEFEKLMKKADL